MSKDKQTQLQDEFAKKTIDFFQKERFGYAMLTIRFGKTRYALEVLKGLYTYSPTVLLCYPDNLLKASWLTEIEKWDYKNPNITFVNFSSLYKYKNKVFDIIVIDEPQAASELERDYCHQIMTNDKQTLCLALSGTMSKETITEWGLKEIVRYTTDEAIRDGIVANYQVTVHLVELDDTIKTPNSKGKMLTEKQRYKNYSFVIDRMIKDGKNAMHLALSRNRLSLSSIGKIEYTKKLLKQLKDKRCIVFTGLNKVADSLEICSYHSDSPGDSNYLNFMEGRINQLALSAMGKMGITYPQLDSVILLNFTYNKEESTQMLQRTLKLDYINKIADLHCIVINEAPELKKIKESLSMLDKSKIKYI